MATNIKKYMSLERLTEYDGLIKGEIHEGDEAVKTYADEADVTTLSTAKTYTDEQVATKAQVQIITWEAND